MNDQDLHGPSGYLQLKKKRTGLKESGLEQISKKTKVENKIVLNNP